MKKNTFKVWSAVLAFIISFGSVSPGPSIRRQRADAVDIGASVSGDMSPVSAENGVKYAPEAVIGADQAASKKLWGDVDGDGSVTEEDADALEGKTLKNCPQGDVNADGKLNDTDADMIRERAWYDDNYFPVGEYYDAEKKFVTRAEWVHAVASELVLDTGNTDLKENVFSDLEGCEYADEINILANMGIIYTDGDENFRPDEKMQRGFAAEVLDRIYGSLSVDLWKDAVENGWFGADKGEFHEKLYVTGDELTAHTEAAKNAPLIIREETKLTKDLTIDKELWVWSDLDLNGHKLTAGKSVIINNDGCISMHKGSAVISGDLTIDEGSLSMDDASDKLTVKGNASINSYSEPKNGIIEFAGDVQTERFYTTGANTVVFSGKKDQTLSLSDCWLNDVKVANSDSRSLIISRRLELGGKLTADGKKLTLKAGPGYDDVKTLDISELTADSAEITGDFRMSIDSFHGSSLTVDGNAETFDDIALNGAAFTVTGDYCLNGGLTPGGGSVHVDGEFSTERGSRLIMNDSSEKLYVGGDAHCRRLDGIKNGTAEFCGILYLEDTSFTDDNTVIFPGSGDVSIFTDANSSFAGISIPDAGKRSLTFSGPLRASSIDCGEAPFTVKNSSDLFSPGILNCSELTAEGSCVLGNISQGSCSRITLNGDAALTGSVSLDGAEITVSGKLSIEPEYFSDDLTFLNSTISADSLDIKAGDVVLTSGTLDIAGDITVTNDKVTFDDTKASAGGKLTFGRGLSAELITSSITGKELVTDDAGLKLDHSSIAVTGDISKASGTAELKDDNSFISTGGDADLSGLRISGKGRLSVAGDMTGGTEMSGIVLEFTGENDQKAVIPSTGTAPGKISVLNSDKRTVDISGSLNTGLLTGDGRKISITTEDLSFSQLLLDKDTEISGDVRITEPDNPSSAIDLDGHSLSVSGSLYQSGGSVKLNKGRLDIAGDYVIASGRDTSALTASTGSLEMSGEEDYVSVGGSFITMSSARSELNNGTLEIKGDFYQYDDGSETAFAACGSHKVILSGKKKQTVTFESYAASHFNYLEMTQDIKMYDFKNGQCWKFPGDANEDGSVDPDDVVLMRQALAGWDVEICSGNVDVNGDGSFDLKDLTILRRYLAGGWDITLL